MLFLMSVQLTTCFLPLFQTFHSSHADTSPDQSPRGRRLLSSGEITDLFTSSIVLFLPLNQLVLCLQENAKLKLRKCVNALCQ